MLLLILHIVFVAVMAWIVIWALENFVLWLIALFQTKSWTPWAVIKIILFILLVWLLWRGITVAAPGAHFAVE